MVAPSKRNCRISQRIARTPKRAQGGAHPLVMFQEYHRLAGAFAAYPASLKPPEPCRDPGPGCVDHLHHHAPVALSKSPRNPGSPPAGCTTQHRAPEYLGCEPRSSDGSPPNRRADHNDQATTAAGRARHRPRSLKTAGVEVRSSPGTSTSTRNTRSTPAQHPLTHTQLGRATKAHSPDHPATGAGERKSPRGCRSRKDQQPRAPQQVTSHQFLEMPETKNCEFRLFTP